MSISLIALLAAIYLGLALIGALIWWVLLTGPGLEDILPPGLPEDETADDFTLAMRANQDRMERMGR